MTDLIPQERIEQRIFLIRGQRVMLDRDLAEIYGVPTKALNQAVKRNRERFPADFMFQLTQEETDESRRSRSQIVTLKRGQNIKYLPYVFSEHGAIMLANVINSPNAVRASIAVVRVFVRQREPLALHKELAVKLNDLERRIANHDESIRTLFDAIRQLMLPLEKPRRKIGFGVGERRAKYRLRARRSG